MDTTIAEIASNFSRHRFDQTYPFMLDDIEWTQVGGMHARGKDAVVSVCEESAKYLTQVTTTFHHFRVIETNDCVVIDTRAEYVDNQDGPSSVASCDIYDFTNGKLAGITSYAVEIQTGSATA